jgi:osmotically-inducible protein OsmY
MPEGGSDATVEPDNTAVNERDADGGTLTPMDQGQGQEDIDRTATIRQNVLEIEDLSVNGRNVKIITNAGKVTLRGPVASEEERMAIERVAVDVAGEGNVVNELEVDAESAANP